MDNTKSVGIRQAGDVEIKRIELIDVKNKNLRYNLLGSFIDLTIYEDIFSPVLSGYIAIVETQNLLSMLPIVGEEILYVEVATPTLKTISLSFRITKVGMREHQDKKNAYTLDFISTEGYIDLNTRLSKAYSGNTGEMVKKIFTDNFGTKLVDSDFSDNSIKFVSPFWGPLKIINHITSKALFPNNKLITPNYLFYQSISGHKFKSLTNLFNQNSFMEYFFDKNPAREKLVDGTSTRDINREYQSIKELNFVSSQDHIKNMINGAYNNTVYSINLFRKRVESKRYSYKDNFSKTAHTDVNPMALKNESYSSGHISNVAICPNLFDGINDIGNEITAKRIALLAQLDTYKINIVVHGRSDIEVGKMITIWMNQFKTIDNTDINKPAYDPYYSGKYLITAISHRFTFTKYETNIEAIKDSAFSPIEIKQ